MSSKIISQPFAIASDLQGEIEVAILSFEEWQHRDRGEQAPGAAAQLWTQDNRTVALISLEGADPVAVAFDDPRQVAEFAYMFIAKPNRAIVSPAVKPAGKINPPPPPFPPKPTGFSTAIRARGDLLRDVVSLGVVETRGLEDAGRKR